MFGFDYDMSLDDIKEVMTAKEFEEYKLYCKKRKLERLGGSELWT